MGRAEFLLDSSDPRARYFSYASMLIPSNDAFIANGSPLAHPVFDASGEFVAESFFVLGSEVNDAGTEVNDEIPMNTAFFGQMMPNVGVTESVRISAHPGFNPVGSGGILDDFRFSDAQFVESGFPLVRFRFRAAPAALDPRLYVSLSTGSQEVPANTSPAFAISAYSLVDQGTRLAVTINAFNLQNLTMAHLHLGQPGQNGPVVANLIEPIAPGSGGTPIQAIQADLDSSDLVGPLAGFPLDALVEEIENGNVYLNLHTDDGLPGDNTGPGDFVSGEIRGQLFRL